MFTDCFQGDIHAGLDDQLVVDVTDDEAVAQGLHGICQDVPADGLHDVLHELRAVTLDPFPLLRAADALIRYGLTAKPVLSHTWLHIGQSPAGRNAGGACS